MTSNKILILIVFQVFFSCVEKENIKENHPSNFSDEVLIMYSSNENLFHLANQIKNNEKVIKITTELHNASGILMEQAGGVNRSGRFINPFNKGNQSDILINRLRNNINIISNEIKVNDSLRYKEIEPVLSNFILDENSKYYIGNAKKNYLETALTLLIIENSLFVKLLENK